MMNWKFWKKRHICNEKCDYCSWGKHECKYCGFLFKYPAVPCCDGYGYTCSNCGKIQNVVEPDYTVSDAWNRWFEFEKKK